MGLMKGLTITIQGREQLQRELAKLGGPELRRVAKRAAMRATAHLPTMSRMMVPLVTSRLAHSIGQVVTQSPRSGFVGARVGVMKDFTYTSLGSHKRLLSTGGGRVGTRRKAKHEKALAAGHEMDTVSAQQYARLIHFGVDKSGRVRRKAGPVPFLDEPIQSQSTNIINNMADDLRRHVETTR